MEFKFAPDKISIVSGLLNEFNLSSVRNSKYILGLAKLGRINYI